MQETLGAFPWWIIAVDYVLGVIMWTLVGKAPVELFRHRISESVFVKVYDQITNPILRLFRPVTPSFLLEPLVPLFVAWFFFMFRFYLMPWLLGYSVMGMLSFPLEGEVAAGLYELFGGN